MAVLVTGGAGYIGSHTVDLLRASGRDCVVYDSLELGHRASLPSDVPLVVGAIEDQDLVRDTCHRFGIDAVIHFAAYKAAGESMHAPAKYFKNNLASGNLLFDAVQQSGVERVVFSSTAAVYGTPTASPVSESAPTSPENPYGESKLMVERILGWYDQCHDVRSVSLRYFNAAGASLGGHIGEDWTVTLNLVPIVMKAVLERGPKVRIFGNDYPTADGTGVRDYIHVVDLAMAHLQALEYLERGGNTTVVNLGTGVGSSVLEVLKATAEVAGCEVPHEMAPRRPGDPAHVYADNRRAREVLGWEPAYGLDEIIESAYRWHASRPNGYDTEP